MSEYNLLYVTVPNRDEALTLARSLVEARLAACANILPAITSFYWWEGKLQEDQEVAMVAKTRSDLVPQAVAKLVAEHSYECPCVVALPIVEGNPAFLDWIGAETKSGS